LPACRLKTAPYFLLVLLLMGSISLLIDRKHKHLETILETRGASIHPTSDAERKTFCLGAARYVKKPYALSEIGVAVQEALTKKTPEKRHESISKNGDLDILVIMRKGGERFENLCGCDIGAFFPVFGRGVVG
jgi:hypothetical protein